MLINGAIEISPPAGHLDVRLVSEPPVTRSMTAEPGALDELQGEPLDPSVDGDVVDSDTALSQQLLDVAVGQAIPQVPANRGRDHLRRDRKPANTEFIPRAVT
jgi:hypothetical protein